MLKDLSVLQESPFTDQGSIVEVFTDMSLWAGIKSVIDTNKRQRSGVKVQAMGCPTLPKSVRGISHPILTKL